MAGKVAVLNDLAGFGRCSLTAAISVLSAMGVQPCPLPTAILSAQTGFESYFFQDLTEQMGKITEEWKKADAQFDGIVTGFMSGHRQIGEVNRFLDLFHKDGAFLLVDPVLGDNGKRFPVFDGVFQEEMKQLVRRADIVTPNVTELCLLTEFDYHLVQEAAETGDKEALFAVVAEAAGRLLDSGVSEVIVTGVLFDEAKPDKTGTDLKKDPQAETRQKKVANLTVTRERMTASISSFIGTSYSGTGDLFASVVAGGKARGDCTEESVRLAGEMIERAIRDAVSLGISRKEGAEYEKYLWMLCEKNRSSS
ncbi:bifunctional hydroxymethylpyrimidine kinase/phosphomethylpyrimidine kinase [Mediterraneibacter sp.]|mgnify:CR=1 FL=1|jgi:pyridoxine kinase|uniref:bifunctional hydroxymethylpyrimidine kinase/phosphomethylpyrimidine kinase n=1 Tax=Mediterraneibacter sp. TaxID=2316022 RepID=UPI0027B959A1|nr:bifunctional hydroxymethylpyrimidine kinase/phosphomethylpyrimidine kinase [Mediterraneibacter sp.]